LASFCNTSFARSISNRSFRFASSKFRFVRSSRTNAFLSA
jgi:hypothetical protein